jgi:arylsulfatase A-like enzyme
VPAVKTWIDQNQGRKLFAYLHFREPHSPFRPPQDLWKQFDPETDFQLPSFLLHETPDPKQLQKIVAAYDANLASADRELGRILSDMKRAGIWDRSIILLLSDHGEAFWEHGKQGHNYPLYEEIIRIPFIIRFPGEPGIAGKRIGIPSGSIDVYPTLVDLLQFSKRGEESSGISLLPSIYNNEYAKDRFVISQTARKRIYSIRNHEFKYVWHKEDGVPENELFHLQKDPLEKENLIQRYPILASYFHFQLQRYLHSNRMLQTRKGPATEPAPKMDREVEEELRALGYVD